MHALCQSGKVPEDRAARDGMAARDRRLIVAGMGLRRRPVLSLRPIICRARRCGSCTSMYPPPGLEWPAGQGSRPPRSAQLVWRHPLAAVAGESDGTRGATFAAICLVTGSIWGSPTWGTWWEWDGRLTSMLILFFLYFGYIALAQRGARTRRRGADAALFGLVGAINLPIIHYSVLWWRTLHQGQSVGISGSSIDSSILWPLPLVRTRPSPACLRRRADADAGGACGSESRGANARAAAE